MHRAMYVPALSLAMLATSAATQPAITRPDGRKLTPAQIDSTVNRLIQAAHVTGAGVALFHRGKIVYLNALRPARYRERPAAHAGFRDRSR